MPSLRQLAALILATVCMSTSSATALSDFIVDRNQGPGTDFTSIQEAVFAASDGDRLFVRTGVYQSFVVRKGLQIQALGDVSIAGPAQVLAVPATQNVVLAGMRLADLTIRTASSTSVIDCVIDQTIDVLQSPDVRFYRVSSLAPVESPWFRDSNFELVECTFLGRDGRDDVCLPLPGGAALRMGQQAFGRIARSTLRGGRGGDAPSISCFSTCAIGLAPGGVAVEIESGGVVIGGVPADRVWGGATGSGASCFDPSSSAGVSVTGGFLRHSGARINQIQTSQSTVVAPAAQDVTLRIEGDALPGGTVQLFIAGAPGAFAELYVGRGTLPLVVDPLNGDIPSVTPGRMAILQPIPATGELNLPLQIPATYTQGTVIWLQARSQDGQTPTAAWFSNSVPLLVR